MPIMASDNGGDFTPAPEGSYTAVGCDVVDKGIVENQFGKRHAVQIRWQLGADAGVMDDGKPWLVVSTYTLSLNEKATLRRHLESWRGQKFKPEELRGFDVEKVIGVPCILAIIHNVKDGRVYANVSAIMPLPKGMDRPVVRNYDRVQTEPPPQSEPFDDDEPPW